jgi:Ca2+-binding EF-hand superfamily protein
MTIRSFACHLAVLAAIPALGVARGQQPGGINFVELFQNLDVNDDKTITRGEVPESGRPAFDRLLKLADLNKDGMIDQLEYRDLLIKVRESAMSALPRTLEQLRALDKDGDGKISRDEFTGPAPQFARIDADKDGYLTLAEVAKFRETAMNQFGPRLKEMDKNGDNKISRAEFTGPPPLFDRLDANKDGLIEPREAFQLQQNNNGPILAPAAKKAEKPADPKPAAEKSAK